MKMCEKHWAMLQDAVKARGLWEFVSANGREAMARTVAELQGPATDKTFDPLMGATWIIYSAGLEHIGLSLLAADTPETECPVCVAVAFCPCGKPECTPESRELHWIEGPADGALDRARTLGLVA